MPSSTFTIFDEWGNYLGKKVVDLTADTFKVVLTNTAITKAGSQVLADLTKITANGGAEKTVTCTWAETAGSSGIWRFSVGADQVWTATTGGFGPFRYAVLYDDTPSGTPTDPLIGYWDYGSAITVNDTETFTLDVDSNFAAFTLTV